jgi:hypothetical protein
MDDKDFKYFFFSFFLFNVKKNGKIKIKFFALFERLFSVQDKGGFIYFQFI